MIYSLIPLGLSIIFLFVSYIMYRCKTKVLKEIKEKKERCTFVTAAILVDIHKRYDRLHSDERPTYYFYPIYKFIADNGNEVVVKNNISINPKLLKIGQQVTLYFNPNNLNEIYVPEEKAEDSAKIFSLMHICSFVSGILVFFMFIALLFWNII
mgnify:FL=1